MEQYAGKPERTYTLKKNNTHTLSQGSNSPKATTVCQRMKSPLPILSSDNKAGFCRHKCNKRIFPIVK